MTNGLVSFRGQVDTARGRFHGTCVICRHEGLVPGTTPQGRTCRTCSGITLNVDCRGCGAEEELHSKWHCWRCVLKDQIRQNLTSPAGQIPDKLAPLAAALGDMARPNSGPTWIRQPHADRLLRSIADGTIDLSHDAFDALRPSHTVEYIRALLIEHGAQPARDHYLAEFTAWSTQKLTLLKDPAHRSERFIRWHQQRRLREQITTDGAVSSGLFLSARQSTAAWRDMVRDAPPSVLAGLLGMTPETAMRHAELAGANFARYAALHQ